MSVNLMSMVFKSDLAPTPRLVLLALADHANDEGYSIWPSANSLAKKTGLSERATKRALSQLTQMGLLIDDGYSHHGTRKRRINTDLLEGGVTHSHPSDTQSPPVTHSHWGGDTESLGG